MKILQLTGNLLAGKVGSSTEFFTFFINCKQPRFVGGNFSLETCMFLNLVLKV